MSIRELEEAYEQLREQLLRGELEEAEFKAEVEKLQFEDNQGDRWKIGWYTGNWYRYDQGQWVQGTPQARPRSIPVPLGEGSPGGAEDRGRRHSLTPYLVTALIMVLLVTSVALLISWNAGWGPRLVADATDLVDATAPMAVTSTPSEVPRSEATTMPSPTRIAQISPTASRTPSPTPTPQPPTPTTAPRTPSATPVGSPSATATHTPSPTSPPPTPTSAPRQTPASRPPSQPTSLPKPSSGRIFFPAYDPNPGRRTLDIHVYQVGSSERELMIGQASQPALSPDGKRLVYRSLDTGGRGIWVRELEDGNTWRWIDFHEAEHPSWSPDGQSIVFSSQQESDREWRLYRTWGADFDRVNRQGGDIFGRVPAWAADGRIIYWECPLDKCGLYSIHPDGTNLTRLTIHEHDTAPAVSPDGSQVAFMSNTSGSWEIYVTGGRTPASEDGQEPTRLTNNSAQDGLPAWSPDGQWLAFVSDREGSWALWVMRPDGSAQQKLFDLGAPFTGQVDGIPPTEQHGWTWERLAWGP